ncbi:MAG: hypothetical protein U9O94_08630 [Nanoarchaeota archaeon]|nr:hypothetical protein [Nanoarchaeota archaeon]
MIQMKYPKIDLTPLTAYLTGAIIGDGNLANYSKSKTDPSPDYRISIDISDREHLKYIEKLIKSIISTTTTPKEPKQRGNRVPRLFLLVRNKALFNFLNTEMEVPKGKKSSIVKVPSKIGSSSNEIKKHFLAGYFDADGGFRGKTFRFHNCKLRIKGRYK